MKKNLIIVILISLTHFGIAQSILQTIRGNVIDKESKSALADVNIELLNANPAIIAMSDTGGNFEIKNVPIGRQTIVATKKGYKPQIISDIQLNVAKEIIVTIELEDEINKLSSIIITANNSKTKTVNDMVGIGGRTFSIAEANRFAGSQNDPSRMARNYAGVSGASDQRNDIIIRGNAPQGLLWRIEGVPVPNPNHFSGQGSTGGPISIINYKMLSNSDFLTGAFPAEYGNATSGVFDIKIRNGNNQRRETTIQLGALGLEALLEGPISAKSKSSYLIGYRYSTLSILANAGVKIGFASIPYYQDASFKINLITKKIGTFKIFGVAGISNTAFYNTKRDSTQFSPANAGENVYFGSTTAIAGISHTYFFNTKTFIKSTIAATYEGNKSKRDSLQTNDIEKRTGGFGYDSRKLVVNSFINKKINTQQTWQVGIVAEQINYNTKDSALLYNAITANEFWGSNTDFAGSTQLLQAYTQWKYKTKNKIVINAGIHTQFLTLNNRYAVEPRLAINYAISQNQTLSVGYGLHNQLQPYAMYFYKNRTSSNKEIQTNKNLDFTSSNQIIAAYDIGFTNQWRIKVETYYQYLSKVPVEKIASSYSVLNYGATFNNTYKENLVNNGVGQNYGLEATIEKFFSKNYYTLITASVFNASYKGSDNIWRGTAFNGNYVINALAGYEKKLKKNYRFLIDAKFTIAGGLRYTPIDIASSKANKEATYKENEAFTKQNKMYVKPDIKFTVRKDFKNKVALEWALDIQNVINYKNVFLNWYDKNLQTEHPVYQNGRFPTVQLKLEF